MRLRWTIILPICALALFTWQTADFLKYQHQSRNNRYVAWGGLRLQQRYESVLTNTDSSCQLPNCVVWDPVSLNVPLSLPVKILTISGFPALTLEDALLRLAAHFQINQVPVCLWTLPSLLALWYGGLGYWIDRRKARRRLSQSMLA